MVAIKSSRVIIVSYRYEIVHEIYVKEIDLKQNGFNLWHIDIEICDKSSNNYATNIKRDIESFRRCQQWLLENHSELIL